LDRLNVILQSVVIQLIRLIAITVCMLYLTVITWAAGSANYAADITPPKITAVSPLKDSQVEIGTPRIEVSFSDILSGINRDTIHLFMDRMEVTAKAVIEQEDVTGQAIGSPWNISYTPDAALPKGRHEVRFSVQDMAGNLATLGWSFGVTVGGSGGLSINGSNSLRVDVSPVKETTDILDLAIQGQCRETDIRLNLTGRITDYPGTDPVYNYDGYNFYYDDYSLGFYCRQSSAVLGYVNASLNSELLQLGLTLKGGVASDTLNYSDGQYHWTVFYGDSGSTYGTDANVYHMSGAAGEWSANSGLTLGGYYVGLSGSEGYNFTGLRGNTSLGGLGLFRFEVIHGLVKNDDNSGDGWAIHWDKSLAGCDLGLDYTMSEPEYPDIGSSSLFTSERRGLRSYGVRSAITINEKQSFTLDGSISRDNLDHTLAYTVTRQNITAGYDYRLNTNLSFDVNYQGDFKHSEGNSYHKEREDHVLILGMQQSMGVSILKLTCTLDTAHYPDPRDTYDQVQLLSSWACPVGAYSITPSLQWSNEKIADGDFSKWVEARLTWDRKIYSDLSRSSIAFFCRVSDELNDDEQTRVTKFGVLPTLYIKIGPKSTLTLVYDYSDWTRESKEDQDGVDTTISLTWEITF
jgi:hypothetical protein